MYTEKGQVHACPQPMVNEPSSPPTHMLVGEVTESLDGVVVDHTFSLSDTVCTM